MKDNSVSDGGVDGTGLMELAPDENDCLWSSWRCLCLPGSSYSIFTLDYFLHLRFQSSVDVLDDDAVRRRVENRTSATFLFFSTLLDCSSAFSRTSFAAAPGKWVDFIAPRVNTSVKKDWAVSKCSGLICCRLIHFCIHWKEVLFSPSFAYSKPIRNASKSTSSAAFNKDFSFRARAFALLSPARLSNLCAELRMI